MSSDRMGKEKSEIQRLVGETEREGEKARKSSESISLLLSVNQCKEKTNKQK